MNVDFITAIKLFFANYVNFRGRSTRAEYWFAALFCFIVSLIFQFFGMALLLAIFSLAVLLPSLAITFRRFHDTGLSGWWVFILWLVSVGGGVIMYGPLVKEAMSNMSTINTMESVAAQYITSHIGTVAIGLLVMLAAGICQLVILCKPSGPDNKYGPNPYGNIEA